jgi:hypothetical protein
MLFKNNCKNSAKHCIIAHLLKIQSKLGVLVSHFDFLTHVAAERHREAGRERHCHSGM